MANLTFERGDAERPRGHALVYMTGTGASQSVVATYLVVLPIQVDIAKYIPPMFAGSAPLGEMDMAAAVPIPPIPEAVESRDFLARLADSRDDDLIYAGGVDADRLDSMMLTINDAAREYTRLYSSQVRETTARPSDAKDTSEPQLDVDDVLYSLMGEHDRLSELVKLTGRLRDAVDSGDRGRIEQVVASLRQLSKHMPDKYRLEEFIGAASIPGERGRRLAELYVDRCYRLSREDYVGLQSVEEQIQALKEG